jgi:hypothetical protein
VTSLVHASGCLVWIVDYPITDPSNGGSSTSGMSCVGDSALSTAGVIADGHPVGRSQK